MENNKKTTKDIILTKDYKKEHELLRRKVWIEAWKSVANANDCKESETATNWANNALNEFDNNFSPLD